MSDQDDSYGWLTVTDLALVARARGIDVPADADHDEIVARLRSHETHPSSGWWSSMSVSELRTLARDHGLDVPGGMHRRELVALLVEHDVPRPPRQP